MRRTILAMGLVAALGSVCTAVPVNAETRLALVIGNSTYQAVTELSNPARDVRAMADFLGAAGFEVTAVQDVGQSDMRRAVGEFAAKIAARGGDSVALVFYAGHGLQVDGENFLVPVDARITRESDVPLQTVRLADVMNTLASAPAKTRIVMLDACRNNPFSEINKVTGRGLAIVDAPGGSILSYSTAPGTEAEDGTGTNSPYTSALVVAGKEPGLPIEQAFKRVRWSVHQSTSGRQTPWESSSLTDDFSFFPAAASGGSAASTPSGQPASTKVAATKPGVAGQTRTGRSVDSWQRELRPMQQAVAYETVIREDSLEAYQAYLQVFKTAPLLERVRTIVDRRTVMVAWYGAVATNTPDAYRAFMTRYSGSDLAATADRLFTRVSLRAFPTALACIAPTPMVPVEPKAKPKKEQRSEPKKKVTRSTPSAPSEPPTRASSGPDPAAVMGIIGVGVGIGLSRGPRSGPSGPSGHSHTEPCCGRR